MVVRVFKEKGGKQREPEKIERVGGGNRAEVQGGEEDKRDGKQGKPEMGKKQRKSKKGRKRTFTGKAGTKESLRMVGRVESLR